MTPKQQEIFKQQLDSRVESIKTDLAQQEEVNVPRMPERVFKHIWLPFFAGDEKLLYKVAITPHWVNFAGSIYQKVHVVDERGQVLFTVPPILDRTAIQSLVHSSGKTIGEIVENSQLYANIHPAQGAAYLERELDKRALVMKVPVNVVQSLKTWNEIFARYGRPPIALAPEEKGKGASSSNEADLDYDFDPL